MRRFLLLACILATASQANAAELKAATRAGFDRYVKIAEARIQAEVAAAAQGKPFLDFELKDAAQQKQVREQLMRGETVIEKVVEKDAGDIPDGLVHHWRAVVFIPNVDVKST